MMSVSQAQPRVGHRPVAWTLRFGRPWCQDRSRPSPAGVRPCGIKKHRLRLDAPQNISGACEPAAPEACLTRDGLDGNREGVEPREAPRVARTMTMADRVEPYEAPRMTRTMAGAR